MFFKYLLAGFAVLALSACFPLSKSGIPTTNIEGGRLEIESLALSPDGRTVAIAYLDRAKSGGHGNGSHGAGLLDWQSGQLRKIPTDAITEPSFSSDGKYLAVVKLGKILRIDVRDFSATQVTDDDPVKEEYRTPESPVFQPGTYNILFVRGYPRRLVLINSSTHVETEVLDKQNGFNTIGEISFIGPHEIIFTGWGPRDPQLNALAKSMGVPDTNPLSYKLKFGGKPEPALNEIYQYTASLVSPTSFLFPGIDNIAVSQDGQRAAFIGYSSTDPNLKGRYNYEIFLLENGKVKQLTDLKSHMRAIAISADGATVAFGSDPSWTMSHDLYIFDLRSGTLKRMFLAQRLEKSPEFN